MANSADSDEMACYEPSHLELHCLHRYMYLFWSARLKGLILCLLKVNSADNISETFFFFSHKIRLDVSCQKYPKKNFK